jgi:zinc transport system substrate-binding protein
LSKDIAWNSSDFVKIARNSIMKKIIGALLLITIITAGIVLLNSNQQKTKKTNEGISVSTSFYPLFYFASIIGGDKAQVHNLTPSGIEPHDYEPTPQDIIKIKNSEILIINGAGFEPWVDKLEDELSDVILMNTTDGIALQAEVEHEEDEHEEDSQANAGQDEHDEENLDPHIWLSPLLAKSQVDRILEAYIKSDPANESYYAENASALKTKLDDLNKKYEAELSSCRTRSFVTSHTAFGYLAREYNLTQVPISGLSPDEEPSAAELSEITEFVRKNEIKYIFFETLISPKLSETIAKEAGAKTLVLDPLEGLSNEAIDNGGDYFTVMEENLKNLKIALECS